MAGALLRAVDPDAVAENATGVPGAEPQEIAPEKFEAARQELITAACAPFDKPALRQTLESLKAETEQKVDIYGMQMISWYFAKAGNKRNLRWRQFPVDRKSRINPASTKDTHCRCQ